MSLAWPWMLWVLPLPWVLRHWLPPVGTGVALRIPAADFLLAASEAAKHTGHATVTVLPRDRRLVLATCAWMLLVLAAARPLGMADAQTLPVSGRDLMIALDVSASMATRDLELDGRPVDRLHAARELARNFVRHREGDRIGLIVFGSEALLHTPLTWDLEAVRTALADSGVGLAGRETAIGDAIALAVLRLREHPESSRVVVLLTDGANTAGKLTPAQATWLARRERLRIHVVGIGTESRLAAEPGKDRDIKPSTGLDERTLREIADQTGGTYRRATDSAALAAFYRLVDELEPAGQGSAAVRPARELYPWPLAAALILSALLVVGLPRRAPAE